MREVVTPGDLAIAMSIRRRVFVEEQGIPSHLDEDGLDGVAIHVLAYVGETAVATGRLVIEVPGQGVLARIAVLPDHRATGLGRRIVGELESISRREGVSTLSLHPHRRLERFYSGLGYETVPGVSVVGEHELITMRKSLD